jgi:tetratricopeptide (TPR) repeat protein
MTGIGLAEGEPLPAPTGVDPAPAARAGSSRPPLRRRLGRWAVVALLLALIALGLGLLGFQLWGHYHFRQARQALSRYHPAEATGHVVLCLRLWPRDPATLLLAAQAARRGDNVLQAEEFLRAYRGHGGDPADEEYALEGMLLRAQEGEVDAVLRRCQELVDRRHPATPRILEALTRGYLRTYRVAAAQVTVAIWFDRFPDDPQAHFFSGLVKEHHEAPDQAAQDYLRVLELDPTRDDVRFRLAASLLDAAKPAQAAEQLEALARLHPEHLPTRVLKARALFAAGRMDEAQAELDDILAEHPRHAPALTERGRVAHQKREPGAEKWLEQAAALSPGDAQAWYLLAQVLARRGRAKESEAALARFQQLQKDQRRMRDIATKELSRRTDDAGLHYEVGTMMIRGGEKLEGLRWLRKALEKDPNHKPTHEFLAAYYQKVGQIGLASRHRQKAGLPDDGEKKP